MCVVHRSTWHFPPFNHPWTIQYMMWCSKLGPHLLVFLIHRWVNWPEFLKCARKFPMTPQAIIWNDLGEWFSQIVAVVPISQVFLFAMEVGEENIWQKIKDYQNVLDALGHVFLLQIGHHIWEVKSLFHALEHDPKSKTGYFMRMLQFRIFRFYQEMLFLFPCCFVLRPLPPHQKDVLWTSSKDNSLARIQGWAQIRNPLLRAPWNNCQDPERSLYWIRPFRDLLQAYLTWTQPI